jgi:Fic family protein
MDAAIHYRIPDDWLKYDHRVVMKDLVEARSAALSLQNTPYQRDWVEKLQQMQLKMEVAGTSRIEGAEFTESELDTAISPTISADELLTRSQRQARAAAQTYRWIATVPPDYPMTVEFICRVHSSMVTGCDDCPPGQLRGCDENVTFGLPRHRGSEGGQECRKAIARLVDALNHEPLVQAIGFHYHFAAMHPFLDGNGRTARALEALILQRAGLRDTVFIAMSNYYYEEKQAYLKVLSEVRKRDHDLTPFISFGLKGVATQCNRLFFEIKKNVQKAVFKTTMYDLFQRLESPRKRVLAKRQLHLLNVLLERQQLEVNDFVRQARAAYTKDLKNPGKALGRDLTALMELGAIRFHTEVESKRSFFRINLDWPEEITESDFVRKIRQLPKGKQFPFL